MVAKYLLSLFTLTWSKYFSFIYYLLERREGKVQICSWLNDKKYTSGWYRNEKNTLGAWMEVKVIQSCLTLCDPMDYTVHGILQPRILEWVAFPFSRRSSQPRDQTKVSCIAGRFFTSWATKKKNLGWKRLYKRVQRQARCWEWTFFHITILSNINFI